MKTSGNQFTEGMLYVSPYLKRFYHRFIVQHGLKYKELFLRQQRVRVGYICYILQAFLLFSLKFLLRIADRSVKHANSKLTVQSIPPLSRVRQPTGVSWQSLVFSSRSAQSADPTVQSSIPVSRRRQPRVATFKFKHHCLQ